MNISKYFGKIWKKFKKSEKSTSLPNLQIQLDTRVDLNKCWKTRIHLRISVPIQPKTSKIAELWTKFRWLRSARIQASLKRRLEDVALAFLRGQSAKLCGPLPRFCSIGRARLYMGLFSFVCLYNACQMCQHLPNFCWIYFGVSCVCVSVNQNLCPVIDRSTKLRQVWRRSAILDSI